MIRKNIDRIRIFFEKPYSGAVYFIIILLISHFFWKFTVLGDESDTLVTFFGINISDPFNFMANHIAHTVHRIITFFGYKLTFEEYNILRYENNNAVRIVWACSGIKQAYIFFCLIALYRGPVRDKLWYIPLGILVTYLFNIFRIAAITHVINFRPEWFDIIHEHLFKYLFYGLIFGMWLLWDEKFSKPEKKNQ